MRCDNYVKFPVYYPNNGGKRVPKRRILIVEDEQDIAELVALHLSALCDETVIAGDGHEGLRLATSDQWAVIILDLRLPGPDGLEICRAVRRERPYQPILMLTSKSAELDRVLGLETGADDYLTKPFSVLELVARVRALFRRIENIQQMQIAANDAVIHAGPLSIDATSREVVLDGQIIELTAREFDLLNHFARNPGRVFRRADLLDKVWGYGHEGYEHTVNSHINRLRAKIEENPSKPEMIVTVWGVGYKFAA
ncbi:MAG: response regulator transcription factor [Proteobacteria bacterium]|nr:response regulator transcription factor [Pseudomonadota bacterium]